MNTRERILTIRLIEKVNGAPDLAAAFVYADAVSREKSTPSGGK